MTGETCRIPDTVNFKLNEQIGTGSFATVFKAIHKETRAIFAVKCYKMRLNDRNHIARAATEIAFVKLLDHPNIIKYVNSDIKKFYMYLGMEYSPYGALNTYIETRFVLPEEIVRTIMRQLLSGLCYLHDQSIFHGDVKPENILIFNEVPLRIKLADFGLTEVIMKDQGIHKKYGSFLYMSPEIHLGFPVDFKSDLFSAGILMYEMLYAHKPYPTRLIKNEYVSLLRKRVPIKFPQAPSSLLSPDCINLVKNLLSYDKDKRLSGPSLMDHPFLQGDYIRDTENHYMQGYEKFLQGVDLVREKKYGGGYTSVTEAIQHLRIQTTKVDDVGLYRYLLVKIKEFKSFAEQVMEKIINEETKHKLERPVDTERLRCMLLSSPELLAAYDLAQIGEMYYLEGDRPRGAELLRNGLQVFINRMPLEPEGTRRRLLGAKMTKWMGILEDSGPGPSNVNRQ